MPYSTHHCKSWGQEKHLDSEFMQIQNGHALWKSCKKWSYTSKDCRKFLKSGDGGARGGRADTEGVCEMCLCNCSDIFIESPPSLSCVLQRASLMLVDGESGRGAVFSIIPEAIVRAASARLTVASWDFTKTQQNIRRKGWNVKIRAGGEEWGIRLKQENWKY